MRNVEKYRDTNNALEAWRKSVEGGVNLSFDEWAQREYEAPLPPTLLDAASDAVGALASDVVKGWYKADETFGEKLRVLRSAVAREKSRPVRNCDKYKTAEEAYEVYGKLCNTRCSQCRFSDCGVPCVLAWIYAESEKDAESESAFDRFAVSTPEHGSEIERKESESVILKRENARLRAALEPVLACKVLSAMSAEIGPGESDYCSNIIFKSQRIYNEGGEGEAEK